jgi:penicillin V acylase-like amidase (Ntn superfamily)
MDKKKAKIKDPVTPADESKNGYKEQYGVIIVCKGEKDQKKLYEELNERGLKCKVVVT